MIVYMERKAMKKTKEREIESKMRKRDVLDVKSKKNVIMDLLICTMATMCLTSCSKSVTNNGGSTSVNSETKSSGMIKRELQ